VKKIINSNFSIIASTKHRTLNRERVREREENEAKNDNEVPRNEIIVASLWHVLLKNFMLSRLWVGY
jgi:ABC-type siderophore export system fused ATPase/permease subunit